MNVLRAILARRPGLSPELTPQQRRRRLLFVLLVLAGGSAAAVLVTTLALYPRSTAATRGDLQQLFSVSVAVLAGVLLLYAIARWYSVTLASTLFLLLLILAIVFGDSPLNVVQGRTLLAFAVPILAASMLLPSWATFIFAGVASAAILLLGISLPAHIPNYVAVVIFFAIATISWLYASSLERSNRALHASNLQLQASEARFRRLAENASDIVFRSRLRPDFAFEYINPAVATVTGYHPEEFYADPELSERIIAPEDFTHWEDMQIYQQAAASPLALRLVRKDGAIIWVEMRNVPIQDAQGTLVAAEGIIRDITQRKASEVALQQMNVALEARVQARTAELQAANTALARASRLKDEFLANMSHELRTPLASILGATEALEEGVYGSVPETQQRSITWIRNSAQHLLGLINDILDLSKVEAGRLQLNLELISVLALGRASLQFVDENARRKSIKLGFATEPANLHICADRQRLTQVLVNLLSNAVKFTPEGGSVGLEISGGADAGCVNFIVWDTGIGIAEADRERLFKPFEQLDSGLARRHGGTGLGLALVQRLTMLHGGTVTLESTLGQGSRFVVTLPWSPERATVAPGQGTIDDARPAGHGQTGDGRRLQVLLAEDNEPNASILADFLTAAGYELTTAHTGQEALDLAEQTRPDVILMDIQMPRLDGLEVIRRLRASAVPDIARVPVIVLTALAMPGDRERSLAAGATAYLAKPYRLRDLTGLIAQLAKTQGITSADEPA